MFLFFLAIFIPTSANAEAISLRQAIDRAMSANLEVRAQRKQEAQAEADVARVAGEFGLKVDGLLGVGPITKATGNALAAQEDKSTIGKIVIGKLTLTKPVFSWGRQSDYELAANSGVQVKIAESQMKESDVRYEVKEAYYGYQLANSFRDFIENGKNDLKKALEARGKRKKDSEKQNYKLEIFMHEIEAKEAEVHKLYELAKAGLNLRVGANDGEYSAKDEWILPEVRNKKNLDYYVSLARGSRGEFRQLSQGILAKNSLAKAELKGRYPIFAILASYDMAQTDVRTKQSGSVFAYDPYNHSNWALGVGLKLDFQWGLQEAKAAKYLAEAQELEFKQQFANQGIETDVKRAFLELEEAETKLKVASEAYKTGKKWLTGELIGYGSGLGTSQGLVEAYTAKADTTRAYYEAVYRHHMAWAALSKAVGQEVDPILIGP